MGDIFSIGLSGLIATQQALNVVANNTANANTPNYSRREIAFGMQTANGRAAGVAVDSIKRVIDQFANDDLLHSTSAYNESNTYVGLASNLEAYMTSSGGSVSDGLSKMFGSLQAVNNDPSSIVSRQVYYSNLTNLTNRFNAAYGQLQQQNTVINDQLDNIASTVNSITSTIAATNSKLSVQSSDSNFPNNDLLDSFDRNLQELAKYLSFNVVKHDNGTIDVVLSNGQSLVHGPLSSTMTTAFIPGSTSQKSISLQEGSTAAIDITNYIGSGQISGIMSYRSQTLNPTFNKLGLLAIGLADQFNQQNQQGVDLNGNVGGNIFSDINSITAMANRAVSNSANNGNALLNVRIDSSSNLTDSSYKLSFDGTNYTLLRLSDKTSTVITPGTTSVDGFTIDIQSGSMQAGDFFNIEPTRTGGSDIGLNIANGNQVAVSSILNTRAPSSNVGTAVISQPTITGPVNSTPLKIVFSDSTHYDIYNSSTNSVLASNIAYVSGADVMAASSLAYGYSATISGSSVAGDTFFITPGASGNNQNGVALSDIQTNAFLGNNTATLFQEHNLMTGGISTNNYNAKLATTANTSLMSQAQARRDSISGVNLDEEAANLLRYQQAYQANAKVISVAGQIFDQLMAMFR